MAPKTKKTKALLVLADCTVFEGMSFGAPITRSGEVVFNTAMTGYQEILTDPSYTGQIVVMTSPHIGNYGINDLDGESAKIHASGLVVKEASAVMSNYRAQTTLQAYLKKSRVPGIEGIDTRALVRHIRDQGAMPALLAIGRHINLAKLKKQAAALPAMTGQNLAKIVSCQKPHGFSKKMMGFKEYDAKRSAMCNKRCAPVLNVIAYDFGVKENILRLLTHFGCRVTVVPYDYPAEKILLSTAKKIDGVFLSNGPGDPAACTEAIATVKKLLGKKPLFGICLGHQILALALGAKTYKLKFGHHGGNQPVMELSGGKIEITSQNHGFAVDPGSLPSQIQVTHVHLNDNTISGIAHKTLPAFSVQYHPEAAPGPHDSRYLFERFVSLMRTHSCQKERT